MARDLPLYNVLKNRADEGAARFHMPGHKGKAILGEDFRGACAIDFTELYGTGNLYDGVYPIADAEELCAKAWGVKEAFFLTGGASMGIMTMLSLVKRRTKKVLIDRGSHRSVYNGVALCNLENEYIYPDLIEPYGVSAPHSAERIDEILKNDSEIGAALITCPTYYGICSDTKAIAEVCHRNNAFLLVDEAHGAHFPFTEGKKCAVALGADLATSSAHKTLPALGQAALLLSNGAFSPEEIRRAMAVFGTSSPSYQIMASIDLARDFMENEGRGICASHAETLIKIRSEVNSRGVFKALYTDNYDPLRLCVMTSCAGISGYKAAQILEDEFKIVCEMADERQILFIITAADTEEELCALNKSLKELEKHAANPIESAALPSSRSEIKLKLCEALCVETEQIAMRNSKGRIAANNICPYPPGIPVIAAGEVIDEDSLEYLYHNGFSPDDYIFVIKD